MVWIFVVWMQVATFPDVATWCASFLFIK